jgi:tetratricopeptide (TPR) repeat protein
MSEDIDQIFAKIDEFRSLGEFKKAYSLCLDILEVDPENGKAVRLLKKLEKDIKGKTIEEIEESIKKLKPLWEKKAYRELVEKYHEFYEVIPDYEPLQKLMAKAESKLKEEALHQKEHFVDHFEEELKGMLERGEYKELILKASQTLAAYPSNKRIAEIGEEMRVKTIKKQLKENKALLKSHNYIEIIKFLERLNAIEPSYGKIPKLIKKYKSKGLTKLNDEQREFIYKGISNLETLMQLKKFEEAIEVANEILQVDQKNSQAINILEKAKEKEKAKIQKELQEKLKQSKETLKKEYKANKENFIKI